ncbi:MAG: hypothetical protein ACLP6E_14550 [Acidimicrobiales bacterium]
MSDSDTFLDNILEGVIATDAPPSARKQALSPDQEPTPNAGSTLRPQRDDSEVPVAHNGEAPVMTGLDALLEGLPPMSSPNALTIASEGSGQQGAEVPRAEPLPSPPAEAGGNGQTIRAAGDVATADSPSGPGSELGIQPAALPLAAPHHILGLPGEPEVMTSHIELAQEINGIADTEPAVANPQSFASIAQEIAATVEVKAPVPSYKHSGTDAAEVDGSSVYMRSRGHRRRRVNRTTRVAVTQVVAIVLLLVVGLAAEYEYVARGHPSNSTTLSPVATTLPGVRLHSVAPTPEKGFVFHFAASGSAQSAPFRVAFRFQVAVSAKCSSSTKPTSVDVVLQAQGRQAANVFVSGKAPAIHELTSPRLAAGTYVLVARTSGTCSWSAGGIARP